MPCSLAPRGWVDFTVGDILVLIRERQVGIPIFGTYRTGFTN